MNNLRENWLNPPGISEAQLKERTLTNLYNARPTWLDQVHQRLDRAVLDAYGWPHDISDQDLLANLLALNLEREPVTACIWEPNRYYHAIVCAAGPHP
ncbi:MAG: hypothetical protein ACE5Q6_06395 [Dehalococcoidia bacterium]